MSQNRKRLLVVEDSVDFQDLLKQLFESEGYHVVYASNGEEALKKLRSDSDADLPGLILLDLMMPVMDGFEFRDKQLLDPRLAGIPVVIMTAHADLKAAGIKAGVKDLFRKTSDLPALLEIVRKNCV
ncbi:MAG: response regulator [Bdellovibrionales bacterium]